MSAKIECFRGSEWSAQAAAAAALERLQDAPAGTQFVALWICPDGDKQGLVSWSKTELTAPGAAYLSAYLSAMAREMVDMRLREQCK